MFLFILSEMRTVTETYCVYQNSWKSPYSYQFIFHNKSIWKATFTFLKIKHAPQILTVERKIHLRIDNRTVNSSQKLTFSGFSPLHIMLQGPLWLVENTPRTLPLHRRQACTILTLRAQGSKRDWAKSNIKTKYLSTQDRGSLENPILSITP